MFATAVASLSATSNAFPEEWPVKPIRVIVPISAGSAADIVPRIVFEQLTRQLGQPIVIENKPGASGTIGARIVAHAESDGYTLLATSSGYTIAPATVVDLPYDPVRDFSAVAALGNLPNVLVVSPSKEIRTVQQLVAAAKIKPMTSGSTGVAGPIHLTLERFKRSAGIQVTIIPFRGAPEALTEAMAGRIDAYYSPILSALPFIQSGKLLRSPSAAERARLCYPTSQRPWRQDIRIPTIISGSGYLHRRKPRPPSSTSSTLRYRRRSRCPRFRRGSLSSACSLCP